MTFADCFLHFLISGANSAENPAVGCCPRPRSGSRPRHRNDAFIIAMDDVIDGIGDIDRRRSQR